MAWATESLFRTHQPNMFAVGSGSAQIVLSLNGMGSRISRCLTSGGYTIATIKANIVAGAVYDDLIRLNIRLAALDLMYGGGVSARSGAKEKTFTSWLQSTKEDLAGYCDGTIPLEDSSVNGLDIAAPNASLTGFTSDDRETGIDLIDPLLWKESDPVDADYTETEV